MATLGRPEAGTLAALELLSPGGCWQLGRGISGYARPWGEGLATQAAAGRRLEILTTPVEAGGSGRLRARLLEDGYPCWLEPEDLLGHARSCDPFQPRLLAAQTIAQRLPAVVSFAMAAASQPNHYLWGGTLGPDFDCSGLVQTAFASAGIWIPRDAYQQERFCQPVAVAVNQWQLLREADLLFFGSPQRCSHVAIHLGQGRYLHSSGRSHGHDGLAIDSLSSRATEPVAAHYRRQLRGAGRVMRCHDGTPWS